MVIQESNNRQVQLLAAAVKQLATKVRSSCFDPINPESRPTPAQQEILDDFGKIPVQFIVAGTQGGKSQTCGRIVAWMLEENHPTWKRPDAWGNEELLIVVCGRTGKQIEESLLPKIRSYLEPGTYKEVRTGNAIQKLEMNNGNRVLFQSLENPNAARERIQSYVAHLIWIDEMPPTSEIIDESLRRVQARGGYFLASFTPLVENVKIQRMVDASCLPFSKKYSLLMLDNPLYADPVKRAKIMAEMALLPESLRNTRLYGAWSAGANSVYHFDIDRMGKPMPDGYSYRWRHVVSVDPALKSALGLTVWAEHPQTGHWYLAHSEQISGIADPIELELTVHKKTEHFNIVRRISDTEPFWTAVAARQKRFYQCVVGKANRKGELIKQFQSKLGVNVFIPLFNSEFVDQLVSCKWSDGDMDKIVSSSTHHMLDSAQYFCDNIPKYEISAQPEDWFVTLMKQNAARIERANTKVKRLRIRNRRGY